MYLCVRGRARVHASVRMQAYINVCTCLHGLAVQLRNVCALVCAYVCMIANVCVHACVLA